MADTTAQAFTYHRAIAPLLWAFVAIASVELVVVHLLLAHWSPMAALALSALTLGAIGWLIAAILSFRHLPVLLTPDTVVMRVGRMKAITLPLADIAGLREHWDGEAIKRRDVLNLALLAYPNVVIELTTARPGKRAITAVAHRLDDPAGFATALRCALSARSADGGASATTALGSLKR